MINITLFSQIIAKLDRLKFKKIVKEKQTDKHNKGFNSWSHLVSMLFCHFARSKSVRDISNGLRSTTGNLNHLGINRAQSKSSVSYQNKNRTHELFKEYYFVLYVYPLFIINSNIGNNKPIKELITKVPSIKFINEFI